MLIRFIAGIKSITLFYPIFTTFKLSIYMIFDIIATIYNQGEIKLNGTFR